MSSSEIYDKYLCRESENILTCSTISFESPSKRKSKEKRRKSRNCFEDLQAHCMRLILYLAILLSINLIFHELYPRTKDARLIYFSIVAMKQRLIRLSLIRVSVVSIFICLQNFFSWICPSNFFSKNRSARLRVSGIRLQFGSWIKFYQIYGKYFGVDIKKL